jgi:hypothetical protein
LKKNVLIVALTFCALLVSCNKKVDSSTVKEMPMEQTSSGVVDSIQTDTVAPMDTAMDSISKK